MLKLVHPAPAGQEGGDPSRRRRRRRPVLTLTRDERRHLAVTLQNLRLAYGSWGCLEAVTGITRGILIQSGSPTRSKASPGVALAAARAAGMSVEAVLGGKLSSTGRCPTCGTRIGERVTVTAGGAR